MSTDKISFASLRLSNFALKSNLCVFQNEKDDLHRTDLASQMEKWNNGIFETLIPG